MRTRPVRLGLLLLAVFFLAAGPAFAADDGWGVGRVMSRFGTRTGVVQLAVACMLIGLFILMRKLVEPTHGTSRTSQRSPLPTPDDPTED